MPQVPAARIRLRGGERAAGRGAASCRCARCGPPTARRSAARNPVTVVIGMHLRASRFRQAEVVLQQGVLGAVATARHAGAAFDAAGAVRARRRRSTGRARSCRASSSPSGPKNTPTGVGTKVSPTAHVVGDLLDDAVGVGERRVRHHAEHPLRLVVVRHQLGAPVGDVRPLPVVEERAPAARTACWRSSASRRPRRRRPGSSRCAAGGSAGCRSSPACGAHRNLRRSQDVSANSSSAKRRPASSTPTR